MCINLTELFMVHIFSNKKLWEELIIPVLLKILSPIELIITETA